MFDNQTLPQWKNLNSIGWKRRLATASQHHLLGSETIWMWMKLRDQVNGHFFTKDNWWELDDDQPVDVRLPFFSDENHFKNAEPIILTHAQGSTTIQCHISQEKLRKCLSQMSPSRHYMRWPKGKKHLGCFFGRYNVCPMENRIPQKW